MQDRILEMHHDFPKEIADRYKHQCFCDMLLVLRGEKPYYGEFLILGNPYMVNSSLQSWQWRANGDQDAVIQLYPEQLPEPFKFS